MKWHELGVARSCFRARGGRATFLPGTTENSRFCGLCLGMCLGGFWQCGGRTRPRRSQALIPMLKYVPRVQAKTQIRSESIKPRKKTINEKPKKVVRLRLVVRQQQREVDDGI